MQTPIANILHQETIRRLSGDGAFERGRAYFQEGRVVDMQRRDASVIAKVRGAKESYDVRLWMKDESLAYACSCPQGQEQAFCKHAVAVALSFVGKLPEREPSPKPPSVRLADPLPTSLPSAPPSSPPASPSASPSGSPSASPSGVPQPSAKYLSPKKPSESLAESLRGLSHDELVVFVLEAALDDEAFRERLAARLRR